MKALLVSGQTLGRGDDALGALLVEKFFTLLADDPAPPKRIFFYNTGARLCLPGTPILPYLKALHGRGVKLMACGTCVEYYQATPVPEVEVSTMKHLLELMAAEPGVVTV